MTDFVKVLAAKKEVTYGTDAAPTLAANAIVTRNFSAKPVETDTLERNLDNREFGAQPIAPTNERQTVSYQVELAGGGAVAAVPAWMELLEGCGFAPPVVTAAAKVEQRMQRASNAMSSLTQDHWIGDQKRKMVGARGTGTLDFTAGAYPFLGLSFTGLIPAAAPFGVSVPGAANVARWQEPLEVGLANTSILLDAFAAPVRSLTIDLGVGINVRNLVGARYVNRGNHQITGQLVIEAPSGADKDYLTRRRQGTPVPLALTHGVAAGRVVQLDAPRVQIVDITESEEDSKLMWTMPLRFVVQAGADDLVITTK